MGKQTRHSCNAKVPVEIVPFEHVAFNVWGLVHIQTMSGKTLMVVVTNQAGARCEAWYLAHKLKEATCVSLELMDTCVETQYSLRVKCVWTDGGQELNKLLNSYCQ